MGFGGEIMYYKIVGPAVIEHPQFPPDKTWVDGMDAWALGAIVEFITFTSPLPNVVGARVKIVELSPLCLKRPVVCPKKLELPYSWLEPLPRYYYRYDEIMVDYAALEIEVI